MQRLWKKGYFTKNDWLLYHKKMAILKKIIELTKPYWPRVLAGIILSLIISAITGAIAWLAKPAVDKILGEKRYEYFTLVPLGVFFLYSLKGFISFSQAYLMKSAGMKLVREMRNKLYNHILYLPISYFNKESSGVIISRIISDTKELSAIISTSLKELIIQVPTVLFLLGVAFYRSWELTAISMTLLPFIGYSTRKFGKRVKKKTKEAQKKIASLTHKTGEAVIGNRIIKIFNREEAMTRKFSNLNQQVYREKMRALRFKEFAAAFNDVFTGIGFALVLWYGGSLVMKGILTPGDLISTMVAVFMVFSPIKKIGDAYTSLQETMASLERVETLLAFQQEERGGFKIKEFKESITFDNVSFVYKDNKYQVLKNINLDIKQGEVIAVVGRSGVGKSTLADLIPRFNKVSGGALKIDGVNVNDIDIQSLRNLIGIVSQDVILFNDTIKENILFGKPSASDAEVIDAAKLAYADEFIEKLPQGYDTIIGERGLKLSGGQRQRLAIARAILKNPPILILDEATSSLDSVSESLVQNALEKLISGKTTIIIAHRLSTIKNADRIVVLDSGSIIDIGSHDQLIKRNNIYMKLYNEFVSS